MKIPVYRSFTLSLLLVLWGCDGKSPDATGTDAEMHDHASMDSEETLYQCSMHPNVVSDKPGSCPICAMDLQKVTKIDAEGIPGRAPVQLTGQQEQLINIRTSVVEEGPVNQTLRAVGRVVTDEKRTAALNSRVMGWVEKLHVDTTGEYVSEGQPLMSIYSPELYSAQKEFLLSLDRGGDLAKSARKRLELLGISDQQIEKLQASGESTNTLELTAPLAGTVMEKNVVDAQMVQPGMTLYKIADLSRVWVQAEIYESELPFVTEGQKAVVTASGYPEREWEGTVDFIYPYLNAKTRTNMVRLVFNNPDGLLKPNMYVNAEINNDLGTRLTVPARAVFDTGRRQYLFVQQKEGLFVPHLVKVGPRIGDRQVILTGVTKGDKVVIDGNFLLDSESQLKAAASGSAEDAPEGMSEMEMIEKHPLPKEAAEPVNKLVTSYDKVRSLLAKDSIEGIGKQAEAMKQALVQLRTAKMMPAEKTEGYAEKLDVLEKCVAVLPPEDLESAREQFGAISAALIDLFRAYPPPLETPLQVVNCPMWTKSAADWMQVGTNIENPFMGQQMLTCGSIASAIEGGAEQ